MRFLAFTAALVTLLSCPAQAQNCARPTLIHSHLTVSGMSPFAYGMTAQNNLITIYIGQNQYAITIEDSIIACIIASGSTIYISKAFDI